MSDFRKAILELLEHDARMDAAQIAVMLGTSEQQVRDEIERMEQEGIILAYKTIINTDKADHGERVEALIEVRVTPQRNLGFEAVAERIRRFDEVQTVYLMSGAYDLMVVLEGQSMRQIALFVAQKLSTLDGVLSTATHFILKKYKDQGIMFTEEQEDRRLQVTP